MININEPIISRSAPSPTGFLHVGTCRCFYFNYLASKSTGGKHILRIDDTDLARSKQEYVDVILDALNWLDITYDQIEYQSKRFEHYRDVAKSLINKGLAKVLDNGAIALSIEHEIKLNHWIDEIVGKVPVTQGDKDLIKNMPIIKADGSPTYNFATVIDDIDFGINVVIRGGDHLPNTARQAILFDLLNNGKMPKFAHVGLICVKNKPLSKRDGGSNALDYKQKGVHPGALLNWLGRMGWGPKVDDKSTSILDRNRMLELFLKGGSMKNSNANIDFAKLDSFDRKYKNMQKLQPALG